MVGHAHLTARTAGLFGQVGYESHDVEDADDADQSAAVSDREMVDAVIAQQPGRLEHRSGD